MNPARLGDDCAAPKTGGAGDANCLMGTLASLYQSEEIKPPFRPLPQYSPGLLPNYRLKHAVL